ncbi:MAG TPA: diacylglycerol kinase family protein [Arachidicoccus sp.]|nr:diacylglycerol kinase family protein [Arachidicoccus sp.]
MQQQKSNDRFSISKRLKSFTYAVSGIKTAFVSEHNMWLHLAAAVIVVLLGYLFSITQTQWLFIFMCIGMVIGLELVNTALEKLCNMIHPQWDKQIQQIKDLAAGAVLIAAITAFVIGLIIFLPYFCHFL